MANKNFLEEYPLYKKFTTNISWMTSYQSGVAANLLEKPAIKMPCDICGSDQTFNMINEYYTDRTEELINNEIRDLRYRCSSCGRSSIIFLVSFTGVRKDANHGVLVIEKVGQSPAWSIEMNSDLENILGNNAPYYKKGLVSESQGYGIAAHAYYRRIAEDVIDDLLESIVDHISSKEELAHYKEAMEAVKKTRVAQEKIALVKDLLPASLQPNGINPLQVIYDELSEGIHYNSDEECLESADAIRTSISYLAGQVMKKKKDHQDFTDSMKKILDKKAKKIAEKGAEIK